MAYTALHAFVYKSHLTFWRYLGTKNATYSRINTVIVLVKLEDNKMVPLQTDLVLIKKQAS